MHATHAHRGRSHRHVHTSPHHAITRSVFCPFESSEARYIRLILYETGSSTPARTVSPPYRDPATPTNSPFQNGSRPLDVEIRIGLICETKAPASHGNRSEPSHRSASRPAATDRFLDGCARHRLGSHVSSILSSSPLVSVGPRNFAA